MDEDLTEMIKSAGEEEQEDPREEEVSLSLECLSTLAKMSKELQRMAEEWDLQMIHALQFRNAIYGAMKFYENLFTQKRGQHQQLLSTMFLTCKKRENMGTLSA